MTTVVSIEEAQRKLKGLLALAREGDEIVIEENGEKIGKITPTQKRQPGKKRTAGLGRDTSWIADDFDDELPDDFWGFDEEL